MTIRTTLKLNDMDLVGLSLEQGKWYHIACSFKTREDGEALIGDVVVYNRQLDNGEMKTLYNSHIEIGDWDE